MRRNIDLEGLLRDSLDMSFLEGLSHAFSHASFLLYSITKRARGPFRRERALSLTPVEGTSNGPSLAIPHGYPLVKSYLYSIEALQIQCSKTSLALVPSGNGVAATNARVPPPPRLERLSGLREMGYGIHRRPSIESC